MKEDERAGDQNWGDHIAWAAVPIWCRSHRAAHCQNIGSLDPRKDTPALLLSKYPRLTRANPSYVLFQEASQTTTDHELATEIVHQLPPQRPKRRDRKEGRSQQHSELGCMAWHGMHACQEWKIVKEQLLVHLICNNRRPI